jgi:hypothetical protein
VDNLRATLLNLDLLTKRGILGITDEPAAAGVCLLVIG